MSCRAARTAVRSAFRRGSWFFARAREDRRPDRCGQVRGPERFNGGELAIAAKGFRAATSLRRAPCSHLTPEKTASLD